MLEPAISVQGLSKCYRTGGRWGNTLREEIGHWLGRRHTHTPPQEVWALRDVSFDLGQGGILGIIGRNGAGKTTLLKLLAGITPPTSGRIALRGRIRSILEIGTGFHPDLTGRQNLFMGAALGGIPRAELRRRFDEIVAFSGIADFIDMPVKHYSGGMYLRLAFSLAFHSDPDILLLDEVLSVGDLEFRTRSSERIRQIAASGATVVLVSHELMAVKSLCNHCLLMEGGKVKASGPPQDIIERYVGEFFDRRHATAQLGTATAGDTAPLATHPEVELLALHVYPVGKPQEAPIHMDDPFCVEIRYRKLRDAGDLDIVLYLSNYEQMLLTDCPIYREDYRQAAMPAGVYTATVTVPGTLLNEGIYYVHLIFGDKAQALLELSYAHKFRVHINPWEEGRKWTEGWARAPLRPRLGWQIERELHA